MKKSVWLLHISLSKRLAFAALFAALCCVSTVVITVPLPASGYFNTGDIFVLLSAWCLGPVYGSLAAAVGSALGDVILAFPLYAPATFIIKGLDALVAYLVWALCKKMFKNEKLDFIPRTLSAILGELVMVGGYFLFECVLYGFLGATPNIIGNVLQGACCAVCAVLLISVLYAIKPIRNLFPPFSKD